MKISQYNKELLESIDLSIDVRQSVNSWIEFYTDSHYIINYGTKQYITGDIYTIDIDEFISTTLDFITLENLYHELEHEPAIEKFRSDFIRLMIIQFPRMTHILSYKELRNIAKTMKIKIKRYHSKKDIIDLINSN